jgi:hypothetical protein
MRTDLLVTNAYHPQSDGQSERANQTVEIALRHLVGASKLDWPPFLAEVKFSHNTPVNVSTGKTLMEMVTGMNMRCGIDSAMSRVGIGRSSVGPGPLYVAPERNSSEGPTRPTGFSTCHPTRPKRISPVALIGPIGPTDFSPMWHDNCLIANIAAAIMLHKANLCHLLQIDDHPSPMLVTSVALY